MKIALIGNMNNNNFAIMRYLRDLGVEADLLLFADDGIGPLAHFSPESDTWSVERWLPFIRRLDAPNRFISAIGNEFPWNVFFWMKHLLRRRSEALPRSCTRPVDLAKVRRELARYDAFIGSGVAPALLDRVGIRLDIYYPYSSGVEWIADPDFLKELSSSNLFRRAGAKRVLARQTAGIRKAKTVVSSDVGYTERVFKRLGVRPYPANIPMVYGETSPPRLPDHLASYIERLSPYKLKFISHARHRWVNAGDHSTEDWEAKYSKHNNWIINAYARFRQRNAGARSVLVLVEYGTDVDKSKALCCTHGIESEVIWVPKMSRIEIMELISRCDVGIGEFYLTPRMIWGGTALEILACRKPLIQGFIFGPGEYQSSYGHPPPPLCAANSEDELLQHMERLANAPELRRSLGTASGNWFDRYNGHDLARRWLDLVTQPVNVMTDALNCAGEPC